MGEWAFGCDVCQDVCPWNRKAPVSADATFAPVGNRDRLSLAELLPLDDEAFRARYGHTPLARPGRDSLIRNACITAANTGDASTLPLLRAAQADASPVVRDAAAWAEGQLRQRLAEAADRDGSSGSPG
jgi:epoxyqueuosine reductase